MSGEEDITMKDESSNRSRRGLKRRFAIPSASKKDLRKRQRVCGQTYEGTGENKKTAKLAVAKLVIQAIQKKIEELGGTNIGYDTPEARKLMDDLKMSTVLPNVPAVDEKFIGATATEAAMKDGIVAGETKITTKQPVMALNELVKGATKFHLITTSGVTPMVRYVYGCTVNGKTFEAEARGKKEAKARAATIALKQLFNIECQYMTEEKPVEPLPDTHVNLVASSGHDFPDWMQLMITQKYTQLCFGKPDWITKRKVLAGVVMTVGDDLEKAKVICVTTGTKCIQGDRLSHAGVVLTDCHAEILARRCMIHFFHDQMMLLANPETADQSIFEKHPDKMGFRVKLSIQFHLYISTVPCGDARIFSPHDSENYLDIHYTRQSRGQLRTKIESGEGTIPVKMEQHDEQTSDGLLGGERLLTMSCSDKICRWNVLGVQGALLTLVTAPIYFDSIIMGSMYRGQHVNRALYDRVQQRIGALPVSYKMHRPYMSGTHSPEQRVPGKSSKFSINWIVGDKDWEIIDGNTGRKMDSVLSASRLSKRILFAQFIKLWSQLFGQQSMPSLTYSGAKRQATDYQSAKQAALKSMNESNTGHWVGKPVEVDQFAVPLNPTS